MKYVCDACGWEYDEELGYPEGGIAPGTKFEDLPEDFECPLCGVGKDMFSECLSNNLITIRQVRSNAHYSGYPLCWRE